MKEFKGSKAPWIIEETNAEIKIFSGTNLMVCLSGHDGSDEIIADFNLIAAAPDLLNAARNCREVIERASFTEENRERAIAALSELNAAISKALNH